MELLYPGIYIQEIDSPLRPIDGVSTTTGAFIGVAERGPMNVATLITSRDEFVSVFGGAIVDSYLYYAVMGFFDNGGRRCYIVRTAHYTDITDVGTLTATAAHIDFPNVEDVTTFIDVDAASEGTWGNEVTLTVQHHPKHPSSGAANDLEANISAGATTLTIKAVAGRGAGLRIGSMIKLDNGTNEEYRVLTAVNRTTGVVAWVGGLTNAYTSALTTIESMEFTVRVYEGGILRESFASVGVNPDLDDFVETRINDDAVGSAYIRWDQGTPVDPQDVLPKMDASGAASLTHHDLDEDESGTDGLSSLATTDYLGHESSLTGLHALDQVEQFINLGIPGHPSMTSDDRVTITQGMLTYAESRLDVFCACDTPDSLTVQGVLTYRNVTGGFDSSYGELHYPWGSVTDPIGDGRNPKLFIPMSGHYLGLVARQDNLAPPQGGVWSSPAGQQASLRGVHELRTNVGNQQQAVLNPDHINCFRFFEGEGIKMWGARTLSSNANLKYIQTRRLLIFIERSLMLGLRFAVFKNIDNPLFSQVATSVDAFLSRIHSAGGLRGRTSKEAYFVKCDGQNNRIATIEAGQLIVEIGLATHRPGEFVVLRIAQSPDLQVLKEVFSQAAA